MSCRQRACSPMAKGTGTPSLPTRRWRPCPPSSLVAPEGCNLTGWLQRQARPKSHSSYPTVSVSAFGHIVSVIAITATVTSNRIALGDVVFAVSATSCINIIVTVRLRDHRHQPRHRRSRHDQHNLQLNISCWCRRPRRLMIITASTNANLRNRTTTVAPVMIHNNI